MKNILPDESRRAKEWHEQLGAVRPLLNNTPVEFIPSVKKDGREPQKNTSAEEKKGGGEALLDASRGHIEVLTVPENTPPPREENTSGAREVLVEDMEGAKINILPKNIDTPDDYPVSAEEEHVFETILDQGFNTQEAGAIKENPIDVKIGEIREKIDKTANLIERKVQDKEYDELLGDELGLAIKDLAERLYGIMEGRGSVSEEETGNALKELLKESATLGSDEWVARFALKKENEKEDTRAPQEEKNFSPEVEAQFQKDFAFAQEDLKNIVTKVETPEGEKTVRFSDITSGQQLLLLENLKDFALDNAKEQALKNFTEEEKEEYEGAGLIKKAWLGFSKTYRRAADMARTEKGMLSKPELSKETYTEVLQEMLGAASEAPEAEWKDGKLQINFISEKDFEGTPDAGEKVKEYNDIIGRFVGIPHEWAYSKNEKEQKQYQEAKESYAKARTELGWLAYEQEEEAGDALSFVASLDKKVQFSQFFSTHPSVAETMAANWEKETGATPVSAFEKVKNQSARAEGWKAFFGERGGLMFMGRAMTTLGAGVAISVGSGFTAPLAVALAGGFAGGALSGGIIGRYMAGKRTGQEIEDKKKLAELGILDENNKKEFRAAREEKEGVKVGIGLADKLEYAAERVLGAETEEEKGQLLNVLADRIHYTEKKISMGVVSFGEGAEGFRGRYELLSALAKAETLFEMSKPETNEKVEKKIDELLGAQEERIETAEEKLKSEKMRQGMKYGIILGGTLGTLFSSIAYAHTHGGAVAETQPAETAPHASDRTFMEAEALRTSAIPKDTLANEILNKIKFAKNYELPPSTPTPPSVVAGHEGTWIPGAVKVPESVLPQPKLGFSANNEGALIPGAVKIPDNFFQNPATPLTPSAAGHEGTFIPKDVWGVEPKGIPAGHGVAETLTPRQLSIEHSFQELGKAYTIKAGDNVWNIIKIKLGGNENFTKLPPREQNFIIDSIKDRIVKMSPTELREIGIKGDPSRIYPGDELRLGKVFNSSEDLVKVFNRAASANTAPQNISAATEIHHVLPSAPKEPIRLAQNEGATTDVTPAIGPRAARVEFVAPTTGGHLEAFGARIQDIPSYADYKDLVYNEIHLRHPEIGLSLYDMKLKDFLSTNPNGLEELRRIFQMNGVVPPKTLPQEALNGSVLDWWTRQAVQDDLNHGASLTHHIIAPTESVQINMPQTRAPIYEDETVRNIRESVRRTNENIYRSDMGTRANIGQAEMGTHMNIDAFSVPREQIPPQYHQWVQRGMSERYPDMNEEMRRQMYDQRVVDMMAKDGYNNTVDSVNHMSQLFGVRTPVQLTHMHSNDTPVDLMARMAWQSAQSSGHLPPNFPNPYSVLGTVGRFIAPRSGTDINTGISDVSTIVNRAIGDMGTNASIARSSSITHH